MHRIFSLRAYGDFVILLQAIIRSPRKSEYKIIASKHLEDLYNALSSKINTSEIQIEFVDFGITKTQLGLFTNKHLIRRGTLSEVNKIKGYIKANPNPNVNSNSNEKGIDYIEQDKRITLLNVLTGNSFKAIVLDKPIYETYDVFFNNAPQEVYEAKEQVQRVVMFPDSRLPVKNIPDHLMGIIENTLLQKEKKVSAAYFRKKTKESDLSYDSFATLLDIIENADFVIGADSLPVHICNLMQKPHYILYPTGYTQLFMTPFAKRNQQFGQFDHFDLSVIK